MSILSNFTNNKKPGLSGPGFKSILIEFNSYPANIYHYHIIEGFLLVICDMYSLYIGSSLSFFL